MATEKKQSIHAQRFETACRDLENTGFETFVIGAPPDPDGVIHMRFNKIPMQSAMNIVCALYAAAIDTELKNHPEYPKARVKIFTDLMDEFRAMIKRSNEKMRKLNKAT